MRPYPVPVLACLLASACAAGSALRVEPRRELAESDRFARSIAKIKVISYSDPERALGAYSREALEAVLAQLRRKGYLVETVARLRTSSMRRPTSEGWRTEFVLDNESALHPYEGYLEVYAREELWEGDKPFTDYTEVGQIDTSYGVRMATEKRPNLAGHRDVQRSVELEAFLFVKGRREPVYQRRVFLKQRAADFERAAGLALDGIPKRRMTGGRRPALSPYFTALPG